MIQKFLSKRSEQEKKLLIATIIIVVLVSFWLIYLGPAMDKITATKQEIIAQKESIKRDLRFLSYKDRIKKESKVFSPFFTKEQLEDDVINADFLSNIEQLSTEYKINLVKSNPSHSESKLNYKEYYASLDCMGKLADMITFMHAVNSSQELLKIVQFNIAPKRGTPNEVKVSMVIMKMVMQYDPKDVISQ